VVTTAVAACRLGVVGYLNSVPLVAGLGADPRFELRRAVPSRVADWLAAGEVDLGLIPAIEYARQPGLRVVPGLAIASRGPVRSVLLFHRGDLDAVRRVALDTSSRTSVALTRVLLHARLGREPEYVAAAPDVDAMLAQADAALVIGDVALEHEDAAPKLDLGAEWTRQTGLPFVWAFWAGRPGAVDQAGVEAMQAALRRGLASIDALAADYNPGDARRAARNAAYLRENIRYTMGEDELRGLREYYRRAAALGLAPEVPEIRFHGDR
jgi:chorismate dehydratase